MRIKLDTTEKIITISEPILISELIEELNALGVSAEEWKIQGEMTWYQTHPITPSNESEPIYIYNTNKTTKE